MVEQSLKEVTLEHLDLFDHLDRDVAVLVDDNGQPWGETIIVCLSQASLEQNILAYQKRATVFVLGEVIDFLWCNNRTAIALYGFSTGDYLIKRSELARAKETVKHFLPLLACKRQKLTTEETFEALKDQTVYYLGSPVLKSPESGFGFATLTKMGDDYIELFLSPESAAKYNPSHLTAVPVVLGNLQMIVSGKYRLAIEPQRKYGIWF